MFRTQVKIFCLFVVCLIVSACTASLPTKPLKSETPKTVPEIKVPPKNRQKSVTKEKDSPLDQMITPKTWELLDGELDRQFKKAGLNIDTLYPKNLVIPSILRFKKVKISTLLTETAKFNGDCFWCFTF